MHQPCTAAVKPDLPGPDLQTYPLQNVEENIREGGDFLHVSVCYSDNGDSQNGTLGSLPLGRSVPDPDEEEMIHI